MESLDTLAPLPPPGKKRRFEKTRRRIKKAKDLIVQRWRIILSVVVILLMVTTGVLAFLSQTHDLFGLRVSSEVPDMRVRILGGKNESAYDNVNGIVSLHRSNAFQYCGGVVVGDKWVLTAAHCTIWPEDYINFELDHKSPAATDKKRYIVKEFPHEQYNDGSNEHDIALLEVNSPFPESIRPMALLDNLERIAEDKPLKTAGWGVFDEGDLDDDDDDRASNILKSVDMKANGPNPQDCKGLSTFGRLEFLLGDGPRLWENNVCATGRNDYSRTCSGDSGGPLYIQREANDKPHTLVGVLSFSANPCGRKSSDAFTNVYWYKNWIDCKINPPATGEPRSCETLINPDAEKSNIDLIVGGVLLSGIVLVSLSVLFAIKLSNVKSVKESPTVVIA